MHYRVHGIGRKLGTEISVTVLAQSHEEARRIAEPTMVVLRIDDPEEPLDIPPAEVNETPNVGAIQYASPAAPLRPLPLPTGYQGIIVGSWILRGCACLCGITGIWNIALILDRRGDISFIFTAVFWISISTSLFVASLVSLAIRELAINSRVTHIESPTPSDQSNAG